MKGNDSRETIEQGWKTKAMIAGALLGALLGLGAAYILVQNAERQGNPVKVTAGEGVRLSLGVMGLLKQVAELAEKK